MIVGLTVIFQLTYSEKTVSYGPTILTTTGIFATFVGIAMGLQHFDPAKVQESVPALLDGLKTAFWASVTGVGGALTIKFRHFFLGVPHADSGTGVDGEVTAADLANQLRGIQQALVGDDESTLITQMKLARSDTNDRLDALKKAQIEALQKLSEMGSKQLIEALKEVIKDFNQKITEQFGDNFKQLNDAVGKLLVWQEQYKGHMESLIGSITETVGSMKQASESFKDIVAKAETFTQVSRDLAVLLTSLQSQKDQLNIALHALADLLLKASGSLPQIETKIVDLTSQLTNAVTQNQREVEKALNDNARYLRDLVQTLSGAISKLGTDATKQVADFAGQMGGAVEGAQKLVNEMVSATHRQVSQTITASQDQVNKAITAAHDQATKLVASTHDQTAKALATNADNIAASVKKNADDIKVSVQTASDSFAKTGQDFYKQVNDLAEKTKQQVSTLDAALSEELKKSLQSLGNQLTALSEKFVQDYTPLTEKLRALVQSASRVP